MEAPVNIPCDSNYDITYGYDRRKYRPVLSPEQFGELIGQNRRSVYALITAGNLNGSTCCLGGRYYLWRDRALHEIGHGPLPKSRSRLTLPEIQAALQSYEQEFPPLCSPEQFALLWDVERSTFYQWKSRGWLKGVCRRTGKRVYVLRNQAIRHLFSGDHNEQ